jgi:hypothetical protein
VGAEGAARRFRVASALSPAIGRTDGIVPGAKGHAPGFVLRAAMTSATGRTGCHEAVRRPKTLSLLHAANRAAPLRSWSPVAVVAISFILSASEAEE